MARKNVRVDLPINKLEVLTKLLTAVNEKHIALGEESPLKVIDMPDFDTKLKDAEMKRKSSKELRAQSEALMQAANSIFGVEVGQNSKSPGTLYNYLAAIRPRIVLHYPRIIFDLARLIHPVWYLLAIKTVREVNTIDIVYDS